MTGFVPSNLVTKLRPAKIRSGLRRRWFLHDLGRLPTSDSSVPLTELGTPYGGWIVSDEVDSGWTCYCVGMGGDVSLERALLERGALVRSVEPVERFVTEAAEELRAFDRFTAHHAAIAAQDGELTMQRHHEAVSSSLSAANLYDSSETVVVPALTLASLMAETGDDHVDLLKLDVEGIEYDLIPQLPLREIGVRVFATQLHHNRSARDARRLVKQVEAQGYRYVAQRPAAKVTFVAT